MDGFLTAGARGGLAADDLLALAGIGAWRVDLLSGTVTWSATTRRLHEVEDGFVPTLDAGLDFYPEEARAELRAALERSAREGVPWDLDLPFVTARGRERTVRVRGRVVLGADGPEALYGIVEDITDRARREHEHARLALVVRQMTTPVIITDAAGRTQWVNDAFSRVTGYSLEELRGRTPGSVLQGPDTDPAAVAEMRAAIRSGEEFCVSIVNYSKDGNPYWIEIKASPIRAADGTLGGFIAVESDITGRRVAEEAALAELARRTEAETMLREIIDTLPSALYVCNRDEQVILWNEAYTAMFPSLAPALRAGTSLEGLLTAGAASNAYGEEVGPHERDRWVADLLARIRSAGPDSPSREIPLPGGRWAQGRERRTPSGHLVCLRTDITRLKQAEGESRRRAEQDELTGLFNRQVFLQRVEAALAGRRKADRGEGCVVLFDLDHFKSINDTLGHPFADRLLGAIAERLREATRQGDVLARIGGDEFAMLLPGVPKSAEAMRLLERIRLALQQPFLWDGQRVTPQISMGAAFFPEDGATVDALVQAADTALYDAKREGRNRICLFDAELARRIAERTVLAEKLRAALAEDRISVVLQPKVACADGRVMGFEALARWEEEGVPIPPAEFVPLAEQRGLALDLGWGVLNSALATLAGLIGRGLEPGHVAVNVSTAQLLAEDAVERILGALATHGLPARRLAIEVTEHVLLDRASAKIGRVLHRLTEAGIGVALDDFGTGYASLSHLRRFPVGCLKIDRSFVEDVDGTVGSGMIARTIIALANGLGLQTIAEGVETEVQRAALQAAGCTGLQGYLIARPMAPAAAAEWLAGRGNAISGG